MPKHTAPHARQDFRAGRTAHHTRAEHYAPSRPARAQYAQLTTPRRLDPAACTAAAAAAQTPHVRALWQNLASASRRRPITEPQQLIAIDQTDGRIFYAVQE